VRGGDTVAGVSEGEHTDREAPSGVAEEARGAVDDPGLLIYERVLPALASSVPRIRRELVETLALHHLAPDRRADIALVVTEAAANAVLHAYRDTDPGPLYAAATLAADALTVWISDFGCGMLPDRDNAGLGVGLVLMARLSDHLQIAAPEANAPGTCITATFAAVRPAATPHDSMPGSELRELLLDYLHALRAANTALREDTDAVLAQADLAVARARRHVRSVVHRGA
jgi:serine/threonine-protein kinase RsbW/stage II sporulation protein AB (anti-sigma F factor)